MKRYFVEYGAEKSAAIPFSLDCVAELYGNFMDDYKSTERVCREAVKNGTAQEKKNCDNFLHFIRTAGLDGNIQV